MSSDLNSLLIEHKWMLNSGLLSDSVKNNLFVYGSLLHPEVTYVDLYIDVGKKTLTYNIRLAPKVYKAYIKYMKLKDKSNIFSLFLLKRILKKYGNLNLESILNKFIADYCGKDWNAILKVEKEQ